VKFAWIDTQCQHYPLSALCEVLGVSVNGYRAWKRGGTPERQRLTDAQLLTLIRIRPRIPVVASGPDFAEDRVLSRSEVGGAPIRGDFVAVQGIACATTNYRRGASRASQ
jgi:hypothetical protein